MITEKNEGFRNAKLWVRITEEKTIGGQTMRKTPTGIVCKVLTVCSKIQWVFFAWF